MNTTATWTGRTAILSLGLLCALMALPHWSASAWNLVSLALILLAAAWGGIAPRAPRRLLAVAIIASAMILAFPYWPPFLLALFFATCLGTRDDPHFLAWPDRVLDTLPTILIVIGFNGLISGLFFDAHWLDILRASDETSILGAWLDHESISLTAASLSPSRSGHAATAWLVWLVPLFLGGALTALLASRARRLAIGVVLLVSIVVALVSPTVGRVGWVCVAAVCAVPWSKRAFSSQPSNHLVSIKHVITSLAAWLCWSLVVRLLYVELATGCGLLGGLQTHTCNEVSRVATVTAPEALEPKALSEFRTNVGPAIEVLGELRTPDREARNLLQQSGDYAPLSVTLVRERYVPRERVIARIRRTYFYRISEDGYVIRSRLLSRETIPIDDDSDTISR